MKKEVLILVGISLFILIKCVYNIARGKNFKFIGITKELHITISKEDQCRIIFENIFGKPFQKIRPNFLKNPKTGKNLELDGYNETIVTPIGKGLGFEYNGVQHYYYNPKYHKSFAEYQDQLDRDETKKKLCETAKVVLITIPFTVKDYDLETYIKQRLRIEKMYFYL